MATLPFYCVLFKFLLILEQYCCTHLGEIQELGKIFLYLHELKHLQNHQHLTCCICSLSKKIRRISSASRPVGNVCKSGLRRLQEWLHSATRMSHLVGWVQAGEARNWLEWFSCNTVAEGKDRLCSVAGQGDEVLGRGGNIYSPFALCWSQWTSDVHPHLWR